MLRKIFGSKTHESHQVPASSVPTFGTLVCTSSSGQSVTFEVKTMSKEQYGDLKQDQDKIAALTSQRNGYLQRAGEAGTKASLAEINVDKCKATGAQHSLQSAQHRKNADELLKKEEELEQKMKALEIQEKENAAKQAALIAKIAAKKAAREAKAAEEQK